MDQPLVLDYSKHTEDRGEIFAFYSKNNPELAELDLEFVQDRCSISYKGTVRGFHGDPQTWKYITCPFGTIQLVTWNVVTESKHTYIIGEDNDFAVLIPPRFLNAHQCLSHACLFMYKQTEYYETFPADKQWSIHYDDPTINPGWFLTPRRVSSRDRSALLFRDWTNNE